MKRVWMWSVVCGLAVAGCGTPAMSMDDGQDVDGKADAPATLYGTVEDVFWGEMDPFIVGDVCVTFVRRSTGTLYGLLEDHDTCTNAKKYEHRIGALVSIPVGDLSTMTKAQREVLNDYKPARYRRMASDLVDEPGVTSIARMQLPAALDKGDAFMGLMDVYVQGDRFSPKALAEVGTTGQRMFGNDCDGMPSKGELAYEETYSALTFFPFLRNDTTDWSTRLDDAQIAKLEAWMTTAGLSRFRIFSGHAAGEACGGSGEVSYHLLWNTVDNHVLYLVLYPYSE